MIQFFQILFLFYQLIQENKDNSPQNTTLQQKEAESTPANKELLTEVRQQIILYQPEFASTTQAPQTYGTEDIQRYIATYSLSIRDTVCMYMYPTSCKS